MIEVIVGTDRPNSNSRKIANLLVEDYRALKSEVGLIDLGQQDFSFGSIGGDYRGGARGAFKGLVARVTAADGLVLVVPEYNGSFPGALKLFIDYWQYPASFEGRPVAYVGLRLEWGGLRPVERLQQIMGYRSAYNFPNRVFIANVKDVLKDDKITDPLLLDLLKIRRARFFKIHPRHSG